jgi:hypothetical protein
MNTPILARTGAHAAERPVAKGSRRASSPPRTKSFRARLLGAALAALILASVALPIAAMAEAGCDGVAQVHPGDNPVLVAAAHAADAAAYCDTSGEDMATMRDMGSRARHNAYRSRTDRAA